MTLTALRGRLYLFGGSGTSSKCFQDLQILDRSTMAWLDVTQYEGSSMMGASAHSNAHGRHRYDTDLPMSHPHHPHSHHHNHGNLNDPHNHNNHGHGVIVDDFHEPSWRFGGYGGAGGSAVSTTLMMGFCWWLNIKILYF